MWKIKNGGLDQYGAEPFEQQQFGTAGIKGVKNMHNTHKNLSLNQLALVHLLRAVHISALVGIQYSTEQLQ